jgi:hypothetical protein
MKKAPVMMFALVCPGFGQFAQGRKLAGTFYLLLVLTSFSYMMVFFVHIIRLRLELKGLGDMMAPLMGIFVSFAISILIYVVSFADAARASNRPPPLPPS